MGEANVDYFVRRAGEEREAAARAQSAEARWAHLELAKLFERAAAESGPRIVNSSRSAAHH